MSILSGLIIIIFIRVIFCRSMEMPKTTYINNVSWQGRFKLIFRVINSSPALNNPQDNELFRATIAELETYQKG